MHIDELKAGYDSFVYKLIVEDEENLIESLQQNILNLIRDDKIILSFIKFKDLEIRIREKTLYWGSWDISFRRRMPTFIEQMTDPNEGFTKRDYEILYLMEQI